MPTATRATPQVRRLIREWRPTIVALALAVGMTIVFWHELWAGACFMGGDTMTCYYPQKTFYADCLRAGELPLWNNLGGHGYPLVAESQTGFCYPTTWPLYRFLPINTAYNVNLLLHFSICFGFTWLYARRLELSPAAAALAALVYTYGWFPARVHWEWPYQGGAWLPLLFWCAESYLRSANPRFLLLLIVVQTVQLLAGHFYIAFYTLLGLALYVPLRLAAGRQLAPAVANSRLITAALFPVAAAFAFALAAIQIVPTWELKEHSFRKRLPFPDVEYGRLPAPYLGQLVAPWYFYSPEVDVNQWIPPGEPLTHKVEAHLYCGLLPLALAVGALCSGSFRRVGGLGAWVVIGAIALLFATGAVLPLTKSLPGFGYFGNPARYSILTIFGLALLSAQGWAMVAARLPKGFCRPIYAAVFIATTLDLLWAAGAVSFIETLKPPWTEFRADSPLRSAFAAFPQPARVFCRGHGLLTVLGVAATPPFLGLSPDAYLDPERTIPEPLPFDSAATAAQITWLQKAGVTHVLSFVELDSSWPVRQVWWGGDAIVSTAFFRLPRLHLYELRGTRGRVAWLDARPGAAAQVRTYEANRVRLNATSDVGGRLVLTDLAYPGWKVTVDGQPAEPVTVENMYRGVDLPAGTHDVVWTFEPQSFYWGMGVSGVAVVAFVGLSCLVLRRPKPIGVRVSANAVAVA